MGICAHNEEMNIRQLLNSIINEQQLIEESEVLVACSGCTDNTLKIVKEFEKTDSRIKTIIEKERKGKASAINQILSTAKNEIIIFISADTLPNKGCFEKLVSRLEDPKIGIVCGKPIPTNTQSTIIGQVVQLLWSFHDRVFIENGKEEKIRHASEIFCIRKNIVNKIPLEVVNDDAYLALTTMKKIGK